MCLVQNTKNKLKHSGAAVDLSGTQVRGWSVDLSAKQNANISVFQNFNVKNQFVNLTGILLNFQ